MAQPQANIVFLFDVNGIHRESKDDPSKEKDCTSASTEIFPFPEDDGGETDKNSSQKWPSEQQLEWLTEFVLITLHKEAKSGDDYEYGKVQWCFKFFDSSRHADFKDGRAFMPFDQDSFESFEKHVKQCFDASKGGTHSELMMSQLENPPVQFVSDAIKIITGSLSWPENKNQSKSLNLSRSFAIEETPVVKNVVYAFFRVPRTEQELADFADIKPNSSTKDFMSLLLPDAFSRKFHFQLNIQLNFVDLWTAPENESTGVSYIESWSGEYPKQVLKSLHYLSGGKVIKVPAKEYSSMKNSANLFGLVPYTQYLRSTLKRASQPNENLPLQFSRLAEKLSKSDKQKTSPNFDSASSISRSVKSSVLDNSISIHSKIRPFGILRDDIGLDDRLAHTRQLMADIRAQDLAREKKRKRREAEYDDYEDEYIAPTHSRRGRHSFNAHDSAEVDSYCEREQRVVNWVSGGNDEAYPKRKKLHIPDVTSSAVAVPMSRPALSKSSHVFQEPAPKLPGSRGHKMLATVERQKLKVNSSFEHKRRSSEGLDTKRMLAQQEVELSSLKHRLNIELAGVLDDTKDSIALFQKFSRALQNFSDMVLGEDNPSLVPLAQALVNYASRKITENPKLLRNIREHFQNNNITAKDLLDELLLTDFTALNRKIISAHEPGSSRDRQKEVQKVAAFREAELQIILRVEIAWCFVVPNEDATENLLQEIVRLLQIIGAYRTQGPVIKFLNTVLLPNYIQGTRFMRELYTKMNLPIPFELSIAGSPVPVASRRDDDSSVISSTSSANLYPEDSASQLNMHKPKRYRASATAVRRTAAPNSGGKKTYSGSKKAKRQIMVATSNPNMSKSESRGGNSGGNDKVSPKRVRRNLFDVQKKDKKDSKTLLTLSSSRLTKSPGSFKSPKRNSPSGFFRAARSQSRRQLSMNNLPVEPQFGSPPADPDVLCPESPATPGDRLSRTSKLASTPGTLGKPGIVQESPEVFNKSDYNDRPARVASLSFYSVRNESQKSSAWEKSESKLQAAKIKDSVDIRLKEELTMSDLEFLAQSPPPKSTAVQATEPETPESRLSIHNDSLRSLQKSISKSQPQNLLCSPVTHPSTSSLSLLQYPSAAPDLNNPEIHSLITGSRFPNPNQPLTKDKEVTVQGSSNQVECENSPLLPVTASPNSLQTPSKRVQFNLNENLVNTPASNRKSTLGTPKSILKETHETLADGDRLV